MGLAGEGRAKDTCLAQSFTALRRAGPAAQELLPLKQSSKGLHPGWARTSIQEWEEEQEEHQESTGLLSLWQPTSNEEFLLPESSFAKVQLGAAFKALLIAKLPTQWQTRA